ncbi:DNA polymerase III subunit delta [Asticcacaulis sp. YBE204]|uniref:DNA polymerase III subunit delta n=1 Tax=Asticcacaulis sp. YBE204 TaxID=1282363 RepID=UPI0003C3F87B|nr:DNA polymerase III subunit delta [Asticcacaulis sp. YBE204]ESQ80898.1 DNA polymerase III subunit delta [Asticcacaulis sp. YBE204]
MKLVKRPEIEGFLKAPPRDVIACLIYGKDRGQVIERGEALARQIVPDIKDPFNVSILTDTDIDIDAARLEDELTAQSLMGGRRLVRLKFFSEKAALDKQVAAALKAHAAGEFNRDAFFLIEAGGLGGDSATRKLADADKAVASIACYEDETGDVVRMARETLAKNEVALTPDAMDIFAARLPRERGVARQEIERLCLFIGPGSKKTLDAKELQDFLGVEPEASLFDAALQAFGAKMGLAQAGLRRAFAEGETGVDAVRALNAHLIKLRLIQAQVAKGIDAKQATRAAGVFWKQEAEFLRQARNWSDFHIDPLSKELIDTDKACKSTGMPDLLIAERLYMSIAGRAKRLGL